MPDSKIATLVNQPLSNLLPYGALVICSSILAIVLIANGLERWLFRKAYSNVWITLQHSESERRRRSFTYFHVGVMVLLALLLVGAYPTFDFLVGRGDLSAALFARRAHIHITIGDVLFVLSQIYSAYYLFELCFRTRFASAISIAHHIGLLIIIQTSLVLFTNLHEHPEATMEFYMCMVWGSFDIVVELPLYSTMILWRIKNEKHQMLARMAYCCCAWVLLGAVVETAITIYLLNRSWHRWGTTWRIATPMVFSLWISTQLYSAYRLLEMARQKQRKGQQCEE